MKNRRAWNIIFAFLLGSFYAEFASDPTDWIYFSRIASGQPLSQAEGALYWYCLTASFYAALFIISFILAKYDLAKPIHIVYLIAFLTISSFIIILKNSLQALDFSIAIVGVTTMVSIGILLGVKRKIEEV
ncbi:MAG: hypothetical protein QXP04_00265 [Candidatus Nanoarchaeia archaeon]|nr:hypothetical protein [Candidatus Jingweiarchaeum tengchongense]